MAQPASVGERPAVRRQDVHSEKASIWHLDECEMGGQTIRLQAIPARMSCVDVLE